MANFTSAFRALAHGSLNWDTQLDTDLLDLEARLKDSGWITSGTGITAASGWTFNGGKYRVANGTVSLAINITRTGAAITANAAGIVTPTTVAGLPPAILPSSHNGALVNVGPSATIQGGAYVRSDLGVTLTNLPPGQTLPVNGVLDLYGTYLL